MSIQFENCSTDCRVKYEKDNQKKVQCGCGTRHKMEPFDTQIVHCYGQHWLMECLIKYLLIKREEDNKAIKTISRSMQKYRNDIAKLECSGANCKSPVGKNYKMIGSAVFCIHCVHETGGQG